MRGETAAVRPDVVVLAVDWLQPALASEIVIAAPQHARDLGVVPVVVDLGSRPDQLLVELGRVVARGPRGLVLATPVAADPTIRDRVARVLEAYRSRGGNVATLGVDGLPYPGAFFPEGDAAHSMARSLVDRGFVAPAVLDAAIRRPAVRTRAEGLVRGFLSAGVVVPPGRQLVSALSVEHAAAAIRALPDAWFDNVDLLACADDVLALGAFRALRERGLAIGTDLGLSGFGDWLEVTDVSPPMTSARIPIRLATRRAIELTLSRSTDRAAFPIAVNLRATTPVRASSSPSTGGEEAPAAEPARPAARLIDVARLAETSIATASRVLNGRPGVQAATAARVRAAASTLRYERDAVHQIRFGRARRTVALLVPDLLDPLAAAAVQEVIASGERLGDVHVLQTDLRTEAGLRAASQAREGGEGLVLYRPVLPAEGLRRLVARLAPVVVVDHRPPPRAAAVLVDHRHGAWSLGVHLADLGHRRIAVVRSEDAHVRALQDAGLRQVVADRSVDMARLTAAPARELAARVRRSGATAVLVPDPVVAVRLIDALERDGMSVPARLSVASLEGVGGAPSGVQGVTAAVVDDRGAQVWAALAGGSTTGLANRVSWLRPRLRDNGSTAPAGAPAGKH